MTAQELKKKVDYIISLSDDDPESAHSEEDDLYTALLIEHLPVDKLSEVLRLQKADFPRWCA